MSSAGSSGEQQPGPRGSAPATEPAGDLLVVADRAEAAHLPSDARLVLTGVGMVQAAVAVTREICAQRPARVVNLGTAGSLTPDVTGLQFPSAVINRDIDGAALAELGFAPDDRIELGGDGPVLGTGDSVVMGGPRREALLDRCQLVDMEAFAIAVACRELGVDLVVIKHVSDDADAGARDWREVVDDSARELARAHAALPSVGS